MGLRNINRVAVALLFTVSSIIASVAIGPVPSSDAIGAGCDYNYLESNESPLYDACQPVCGTNQANQAISTGAAPTSLTGATNEEKVWNYFTARGLTPVAAAGAMGNIGYESNFSASAQEANSNGGLGIIQWTGTRRTNLENAATQAGITLADNDASLLFELNYLWDGEFNAMTWQTQVNAETTVEGNTEIASYNSNFASQRAASQTGNGSTMVFHSLVERSNDVPTVADQYNGVGVLTGRIDTAREVLQQFGGGSTSTGGSSCSATGLTFDQAVTLGKELVDNWYGNFCGSGSIKSNFYCKMNVGYCTAGAAWLAVTTAPDPGKVPGIPDGVLVANRLISSDPDVYTSANPDGSNLQPFSIWSFGDGSSTGEEGHTGTIVGVGTDGSIVTIETNWSGNTAGSTNSVVYPAPSKVVDGNTVASHTVAIFEYPSFDAFKTSHKGYVYNNTATPKDSSIAAEMFQKITAVIGN